ncbi:MAG: hypothetical protein Q9160_002706 [Pyrenula sp. 1 TL-2023]
MTVSGSVAQRHWARLIQRWPVDRVRPANVSFQTVMQSRLDRFSQNPSLNTKAQSVKSNDALVTPTTPPRWDESHETRQANVLYNLLEDKYAHKYPVPEILRYPDFNPAYYDDLIEELESAPDRTPIQRWWLNLTGRFKLA